MKNKKNLCILIIVLITGIILIGIYHRFILDESDEISIFEKTEPNIYKELSQGNLINQVNKSINKDDTLIKIEEVYYDQNIIVIGMYIEYLNESTPSYRPIVTYQGNTLDTMASRINGTNREEYLLKVLLEETLPDVVTIEIALENEIDNQVVKLVIDSQKSNKYIASYSLVDIKSEINTDTTVGQLYLGPYGIIITLFDIECDGLSKISICTESEDAISSVNILCKESKVKAYFPTTNEIGTLIFDENILNVQFYKRNIDEDVLCEFEYLLLETDLSP